MGLMNRKIFNRVRIVALSSISQLIFPASGFVISWAVFHYCSEGLWGQFVEVFLIMNFVPHIMAWGNKDYLLRMFSLQPALAHQAWIKSLTARLLLIIPLLFFLLLYPFSLDLKIFIFSWCIFRYIYQSYDVIILYKRHFIYTLIVEIFGLILILLSVLMGQQNIDLEKLVLIFMIAEFAKATTIMILFFNEFPLFYHAKTDLKFFSAAFFFFILGFSGLVQSRTDLLCINYFLPKDKVAQFQVFTSFLLYTQAISAFIVSPFIKNIYRLGSRQILKLSSRLFGAGIIVIPLSLVVIYFVIVHFYHFNLGIFTMLLGGLSVLPIYFYLPLIYELYKLNKQSNVLIINVSGILLGFICNIIFIKNFTDGINGALAATALVQWLFIPVYLLIRKSASFSVITENADVSI
jgi:hypothetical protein